MYKVYVKTDGLGCIISVNSDAFLSDMDGWTQVDEGEGDRYHHAQGNYLNGPLVTDEGVYRYKLVDGKVMERTAEEIQADVDAIPPPPPSTEALNKVAILTFRKLSEENKFDEATMLDNKEVFPAWKELIGTFVKPDVVVRDGDNLFRVQGAGHTFAEHWRPGIETASLFLKIGKPGEVEAWSPGNYAKDVRVIHNGYYYLSMVDNNHYEPGSPGVYDNVWKKEGPV